MKTKSLLLLVFFFAMEIQGASAQSSKKGLPVIDLTKNYPKKEIRLQDIADIEYIRLETTDDLLLSGNVKLSAVTDKYLLLHEPLLGDIYVFNRKGKLHSRFKHKGQSGQEYMWITGGCAGTFFDEKAEEIYVCSQYIQVYSLSGEYKRTLKINTIERARTVFHFNDEALLVYEDTVIDPGFEKDTKASPYSLISKKDGSLISVLDIHFPERYSNREQVLLDNNMYTANILAYPDNRHYGQDFVIADISSDTLYLLKQNKELIPLFTRKPSIHASVDPKTIWAPQFTTNKFMILGLIPLVFNPEGGKFPVLMYEFETGEISSITFLYADERRGKWGSGSPTATAKNSTAELIHTEYIIENYRLKRLKGELEKLAQTLDEDDNPIVRIVTFK